MCLCVSGELPRLALLAYRRVLSSVPAEILFVDVVVTPGVRVRGGKGPGVRRMFFVRSDQGRVVKRPLKKMHIPLPPPTKVALYALKNVRIHTSRKVFFGI